MHNDKNNFMKRAHVFFILFWLFVTTAASAQPKDNLLCLWYDKPATNWNEALPIGNGKLAAMIFGGTFTDEIQLNEETIWAGGPGNNILPNVFEPIVEIRKLIFEGKYKEAQDLSNKTFPRAAPPGASYGMQYQTAGSLLINTNQKGEIKNYRRQLDIATSVATTTFEIDGVKFKREYIASIPGKVIVLRLTADKPRSINFDLGMKTPFRDYEKYTKNGQLYLTGLSSSSEGKKGKVRYQVRIVPKIEEGTVSAGDSLLKISNATSVTIYISIATNFVNYKNLSANPDERNTTTLKNVTGKSFDALKAAHTGVYKKYFDRVKLDLGTTSSVNKTIDVRLKEFATNYDPALVSLYFQFGRYLLISSSFPGSQPANLQGKWNHSLNPPWDSKYTVNINTEMNYWPAEVTALPEMHTPLFKMLEELSVTGSESASKMYRARGWNLHHNTDLWRITGPVDGGFYGMWPMGGAWLSQHIFQHYLYTGDKNFLTRYYDVLKGVAMFYVDVLQEEPTHKWLVVIPSMSPENTYMSDVGISAGTTMDNQLVFDVFFNVIRSAAVLRTDKKFSDTLQNLISRLPPMQVGQHGQLQEWLNDWDRKDDKHRHVSHLYGLYPAAQISPFKNPELFEAAKNSLVNRGDKSTGWSMGWKVNLWARLLDGDRAYKLISDQLSPASMEASGQNGGTYPNLFDAHPPFQIDGNFGCTSGIAEMLMQSHNGAIHLLPAIPVVWKSGSVKGLIARGGFVVDVKWNDGHVTYLKIKSALGGNCRLRLPNILASKTVLTQANGANKNPFYQVPEIKTPLVSKKASLSGVKINEGMLFDFDTKAGSVYEFVQK